MRSPGGGNGNSLQYSFLETPMGRRAWWAMTHRVTKSWTWLSTRPSWPSLSSLNGPLHICVLNWNFCSPSSPGCPLPSMDVPFTIQSLLLSWWFHFYETNISVGFWERGKGENGIETCILSCKKLVASLCSIQDTGCLGLVHGDDPARWYGVGGGFRIGNSSTPMADSCQCMVKLIQYWKVK